MRWEDYRSSENVEDRRGDSYTGDGSGGGLVSLGGGGLGIGVIVVVFLVSQVTGIDFRSLLGGAEALTRGGQQTLQSAGPAPPARRPVANDRTTRFVSKVLAETEDVWSKVLPAQKGVAYEKPKLVLYEGSTGAGGCGEAQTAMGPFYCPTDRKVYLDVAFFREMQQRLGGGGDFAYAYVIAHEIGHHVQNVLGILPKVQQLQQQASTRAEANGLSVRVELQADCLAGVWAANADKDLHLLAAGDVDQAVATAEAIGDDRLQRATRGAVVPDSFTHGTSAQREKWLQLGLRSGRIDSCNTFSR